MEFKLEKALASAADSNGANRIDTTGKYTGVFTSAEYKATKNGHHSIVFTFKSMDGKTADFMRVNVQSKEGVPYFGFNTVCAMAVCMGLSSPTASLKSAPMQVERYNHDKKDSEVVTIDGFPSLCNKPIGVLLAKAPYIHNGKEGYNMEIVGVYRASDEFTASEINSGAASKSVLDKMVANTKDKEVRHSDAGNSTSTGTASTKPKFDDLSDDDIPF